MIYFKTSIFVASTQEVHLHLAGINTAPNSEIHNYEVAFSANLAIGLKHLYANFHYFLIVFNIHGSLMHCISQCYHCKSQNEAYIQRW